MVHNRSRSYQDEGNERRALGNATRRKTPPGWPAASQCSSRVRRGCVRKGWGLGQRRSTKVKHDVASLPQPQFGDRRSSVKAFLTRKRLAKSRCSARGGRGMGGDREARFELRWRGDGRERDDASDTSNMGRSEHEAKPTCQVTF